MYEVSSRCEKNLVNTCWPFGFLESCYIKFGCIQPYNENTNLFITPGFKFNVIDKLITNFHLPKSSLLILVSAFAGKEKIFKLYKKAIKNDMRFFSYGDGMLLDKKWNLL